MWVGPKEKVRTDWRGYYEHSENAMPAPIRKRSLAHDLGSSGGIPRTIAVLGKAYIGTDTCQQVEDNAFSTSRWFDGSPIERLMNMAPHPSFHLARVGIFVRSQMSEPKSSRLLKNP